MAGVEHRMFLHGLGFRELGPLAMNPLTFPGTARAKASVVRDMVGDGCEYGKIAPRSLEPR